MTGQAKCSFHLAKQTVHTCGSSNRSFKMRCEDIITESPLITWSNVPKTPKLWCGLCTISRLARHISRTPNKGLRDEKRFCIGEFPSMADWSNKPNGRGHIDVIVQGRGMDTTSPVCVWEKEYEIENISLIFWKQISAQLLQWNV